MARAKKARAKARAKAKPRRRAAVRRKAVRKTRAVVARKAPAVAPRKAVTIIISEGKPDPVVDPPIAAVYSGGTVTFRSRVGRLTVFVPTPARAKKLFQRARGPMLGVPSDGKTLTVSVGASRKPREYTYAVYCNRLRAFAKASFPKIIVYDF